MTRVPFAQLELETEQGDVPENGFQRSAEAVVSRWPDSKGAEDVHQHERDETRRRIHPTLTGQRLYRAQVEANIASKCE